MLYAVYDLVQVTINAMNKILRKIKFNFKYRKQIKYIKSVIEMQTRILTTVTSDPLCLNNALLSENVSIAVAANALIRHRRHLRNILNECDENQLKEYIRINFIEMLISPKI